MKLLIVTQVVDRQHPILGFFHRWLEEFSKHCEHIHVIALQVGEYDLPHNVTVHSLGKESGVSRIKYVCTFYRLIYSLREEYDAVFVHMNQIYVILGGLLWRVWGKRIGLWYMHGSVSTSLRFAEWMTHHIFTGSPESFRLSSKKVIITGHGIDVQHFAPQPEPKTDIDLLTIGRITESKQLMVLVRVLAKLDPSRTLTICGRATSPAEHAYEKRVREEITKLNLTDRVTWLGQVAQADLPQVLSRSRTFVTAAQNGSLDKVVLEALACGMPVVSMAPGTQSIPLGAQQVANESEFIAQLQQPQLETGHLVEYVRTNHSLQSLIPNMVGVLRS